MFICIVSGCQNNAINLVRNVSLHKFPKDPIVREAWLRNIGRTDLVQKCARVCSVHFSEQCFQQPRRKKNAEIESVGKIRRLVPHAVPTLLLHAPPVIPYVPFVVRREFPLLIAKPGNSKDGKVIADLTTTHNAATSNGINRDSAISQLDINDAAFDDVSPDSCNVTASSANIETASAQSQSNPWLDGKYRSCHSPPRETNLLVAERCKSEPRTFGRTQQTCRRTRFKKKSKIQSRSDLRRERECCSVEPSPLYKRRERFYNETCLRNNQDNSQKDTEKEDPRCQDEILNELVQHYRSIFNFHMQSGCSATSRQTSVEVENEALKLQLQQANAEMERLRTEKKNLDRSMDKAVEQPVDRFSGEIPEKMQDMLKQYFTEGQIKSILEAKYRYFVYNL